MQLKHVSLDIWNTLVKPRPSYGYLRSIMIADHLGIEPEHAEEIYKQSDKLVGLVGKPNGDALTHVCRMLYDAAHKSYTADEIAMFRWEMENLFAANAPQIKVEVVEEIVRLHDRGITFSVTSNVGLMNGFILRDVLQKQGLPLLTHTFDDEVGYSKPSEQIFAAVIEHVQQARSDSVQPGSILHIGDDAVCDAGGEPLGIRCLIIEGVDGLLPVLREIQ